MASRVGVAILGRAPIPGQAKTRLIPALGAEGAARLHRWLLRRTVAMAPDDNDAVVIPAEDGGYVLIGMRKPAPEPFAGVRWGSNSVMAQTRQRLATMEWQWAEPDPLWDVDRPQGLDRLHALFPEALAMLGASGGTQ